MESQDLNYEEKFHRFSNMISTKTLQGYMIVDRNDKALVAVLAKQGEKVNHLLHFLISCFTCGFWILVWVYLSLVRSKERRLRISIDSAGNSNEEKIKI